MRAVSLFSLIFLIFAHADIAHAKPRRTSRLLPGGIVYPSYMEASKINAGALALERSRGMTLTHRSLFGEDGSQTSRVAFTTSEREFGLGGSFFSDLSKEGRYGFDAGFGMRLGDINAGIMVEKELGDGENPTEYSASLNYAPKKHWNASLIYRDFEGNTGRIELGLGYSLRFDYFVEGNVLFERRNEDNGIISRLAAGRYFGEWGVSGRTDINLQTLDIEFSATGSRWFSKTISGLFSISSNPGIKASLVVLF